MFQTKGIEKLKTHILCSITFFFFENHTAYGITWKIIKERDRPQFTKWRTRVACWIPNVTNTHTHSEHVIDIAFPTATMVT